MSDEDLVILAEELLEFCDVLQHVVGEFRGQIAKLFGEPVERRKWDAGKIRWETAEGFKGSYERSEDVDSMDFKMLLKDLNDHNGRATYDGYFYWVFRNGATIGRKKLEALRRHG